MYGLQGGDDVGPVPDKPPAPTRVTGSVSEGVENGSVVLTGDDGRVWQIGRRWQHLTGRRVDVVGRPQPDLLTTAQQGVVLLVDEVTDLGPGVPPPNAM
jgi:hypothetical protein